VKRNPFPTYGLHKQSGRGRVIWYDSAGTRQQKLLPGLFNSPESRTAFVRFQLELEVSPASAAATREGFTVAELLAAFLEYAKHHYRHPDGTPTSEVSVLKGVIRAVRELHAETPAAEFGPLALKTARQLWVNEGLARTGCNRRVRIVRRIFKWAVSEELIPPAVYQGLAAVAALQRGRTDAHDLDPVRPVEDSVVDATLPHLNRFVRGLVEFQRLTGCRPGEACRVRRSDIDTGGEVWLYSPRRHKNSHRGKSRVVAIGPKAQALLREFFVPDLEDYLFSPQRASEEVRFARAAARKTPRWPSHLARNAAKRVKVPKRTPKDVYDGTSYARAVRKAAIKAGVPHWHPNQLRHSYATKARKMFSLEHAGAALGHSKMSVTEVYAERDGALAATVAAKIG